MPEASPLPTSTRRLFSPASTLVLIVIAGTLLSLFAIQLDISESFHSTWSAITSNRTSHESQAVIDTDLGTQYRLANALTGVPTVEEIKTAPHNYKWYTEAKLRWLTACLTRGDCPKNAEKVIVFSTFHCHWALYEGYHGGEGIWCLGMMDALEKQGYTVLQGGDNDWEYMYHLNRQFPDLIRVIISEEGEESRHGTTSMYLKSKDKPDGIPPWKFFAMSYYPAGWTTTVGHAWVVTAEPGVGEQWDVSINPATGNAWVKTGEEELHTHTGPDYFRFTYLGYAVHPQVSETAVVPWDTRPNQVWIMGKFAHYFHNGDQMVYDMDYYQRAHDELSKEFEGFQFVGAIEDSRSQEDKDKWGPIPSVIKNVGKLNREEFEHAFGQSKLMLGIGAPPLSPSPYQALAKAVPFANPHKLRAGGDGGNDRDWSFVQHESLERVPEPYVYQVEAFNYTSFVDTIRRALKTPIGQFRFERMKDEVMQKRMADFVDADWYGKAKEVLEARKNGTNNEGGNTAIFEL